MSRIGNRLLFAGTVVLFNVSLMMICGWFTETEPTFYDRVLMFGLITLMVESYFPQFKES